MVKKFNALQTTYTKDLVKKADYNAKIGEIEKKTWSWLWLIYCYRRIQ